MRNFKIFLWIFVIFLVQTVVLSPIHIFGAVPSAVLAFVMCVAILENEFRTAVIISGICAVVMGAIGGRNFTEITLFYAYSSIIVFAARNVRDMSVIFRKRLYGPLLCRQYLKYCCSS